MKITTYQGALPRGTRERKGWYRCRWCGIDKRGESNGPRSCLECRRYDKFAAVGKAS
jgi:hypothetical protein